jgi:hypothetical protein
MTDKILILKDNNGATYWPEFEFNGIGNLLALEGYQIKLNAPVSNFSFCEGIALPSVAGCIDCQALNFDRWATTDDGTCNYDTDGDGIYDSDEIVGCQDVTACNYDALATDSGDCTFAQEGYDCDGNSTGPQIGDYAEGGIVFYIDASGEHGYAAQLTDLGSFNWGCTGTQVGAVGDDGYSSTFWSVTYCGDSNFAAKACWDDEGSGYDNWHLPSQAELLDMYTVIGPGSDNEGNFASDCYWSSTEVDANKAKAIYFQDESIQSNWKYNSCKVRAIRSF